MRLMIFCLGNLSTSSDGSHDGKSSMKDSKGNKNVHVHPCLLSILYMYMHVPVTVTLWQHVGTFLDKGAPLQS